jgi:GH15 family glucan-1,4-alpha-glucosidase
MNRSILPRGNFPQAFPHLTLIASAAALIEAASASESAARR